MDNIDDLVIEPGNSIKTIPEGVYDVQITNIKKEVQPVYKQEGKEETVLNFEFTVLDGEHSGVKLFKRIRPKLTQPGEGISEAHLSKLARTVVKDYDPKVPFHVSQLKDGVLKVVVEVNEKGFNKITSFMKAK